MATPISFSETTVPNSQNSGHGEMSQEIVVNFAAFNADLLEDSMLSRPGNSRMRSAEWREVGAAKFRRA
jgi:hypothetical protein